MNPKKKRFLYLQKKISLELQERIYMDERHARLLAGPVTPSGPHKTHFAIHVTSSSSQALRVLRIFFTLEKGSIQRRDTITISASK